MSHRYPWSHRPASAEGREKTTDKAAAGSMAPHSLLRPHHDHPLFPISGKPSLLVAHDAIETPAPFLFCCAASVPLRLVRVKGDPCQRLAGGLLTVDAGTLGSRKADARLAATRTSRIKTSVAVQHLRVLASLGPAHSCEKVGSHLTGRIRWARSADAGGRLAGWLSAHIVPPGEYAAVHLTHEHGCTRPALDALIVDRAAGAIAWERRCVRPLRLSVI
jgi:hypothetical protein